MEKDYYTEQLPLEIPYEEKTHNSFGSAVESIKETFGNDINSKFNTFGIVDVDGTLISDNKAKLPIISHFITPIIDEGNCNHFNKLLEVLHDKVVIATNRGEEEDKLVARIVNWIFNSKKVLIQVNELIVSSEKNIPIFTGLFKQVPALTKYDEYKQYQKGKEDISRENNSDYLLTDNNKQERVINTKVDELVHYIGKAILEDGDDKEIILIGIEDVSIVSPNRKSFFVHLGKRLNSLYGLKNIRVVNYVIKQ